MEAVDTENRAHKIEAIKRFVKAFMNLILMEKWECRALTIYSSSWRLLSLLQVTVKLLQIAGATDQSIFLSMVFW